MAEFAGYIGNQYPPTDWGKIGSNLLEQFDKEDQRRKEEKEKIDNDYADSFAKIGEYEQTTDQDVNEFIYKGVDEVRNGIKTQYDLLKKGAITMADYKLYKNTAMSDWSNLNKAVKGFGATIEASQKLITEGKMSGLGQYNSLNFAKLGDLKTAKIMVNPQTGRIYRANIDPKTGKIASPDDVYSPSAMINPANLVDLKVNLDDQIDPFLKRLETVGVAKNLGNGVIEVDESARNNPAFKTALDAQVNAVTATPRSTTSILTDYVGDYQFFESEAQKKELIAKGVSADKLIQVKRKNGIAEPILTEEQEKVAKDFVRNQIEVGVGGKESLTKPNAPRYGRSGGGGTKEEKYTQGEENIVALGDQVLDVIDDIKLRGTNTQFRSDILNAAYEMGVGAGENGALTQFATLRTNKKGGVDIIDKADAKSPYSVRMSVTTPEEVLTLLGGGNSLESRAKWRKYLQLSSGAKGYTSTRGGQAPAPTPQPKPTPKPSATKTATMAQINAMTPAQRGGLTPAEYANYLKTQGYTIK
jgi:hypothetical protein